MECRIKLIRRLIKLSTEQESIDNASDSDNEVLEYESCNFKIRLLSILLIDNLKFILQFK